MRRLLLHFTFLTVIVALGGLARTNATQAVDQTAPGSTADAITGNARTAEALLTALENEDLESILDALAPEVVLVLPLAPDGNNAARNVDRFDGKEAIHSALQRNFLAYKRIAFTDAVLTASANGRVVFVEARGDFETLHGRPYRNVYLIKLVFDDAGAITLIEEWTNPVTASMTWGFPLGSSTVPHFTAVGLAIAAGLASGTCVFLLRRPLWSGQVEKAV